MRDRERQRKTSFRHEVAFQWCLFCVCVRSFARPKWFRKICFAILVKKVYFSNRRTFALPTGLFMLRWWTFLSLMTNVFAGFIYFTAQCEMIHFLHCYANFINFCILLYPKLLLVWMIVGRVHVAKISWLDPHSSWKKALSSNKFALYL